MRMGFDICEAEGHMRIGHLVPLKGTRCHISIFIFHGDYIFQCRLGSIQQMWPLVLTVRAYLAFKAIISCCYKGCSFNDSIIHLGLHSLPG